MFSYLPFMHIITYVRNTYLFFILHTTIVHYSFSVTFIVHKYLIVAASVIFVLIRNSAIFLPYR